MQPYRTPPAVCSLRSQKHSPAAAHDRSLGLGPGPRRPISEPIRVAGRALSWFELTGKPTTSSVSGDGSNLAERRFERTGLEHERRRVLSIYPIRSFLAMRVFKNRAGNSSAKARPAAQHRRTNTRSLSSGSLGSRMPRGSRGVNVCPHLRQGFSARARLDATGHIDHPGTDPSRREASLRLCIACLCTGFVALRPHRPGPEGLTGVEPGRASRFHHSSGSSPRYFCSRARASSMVIGPGLISDSWAQKFRTFRTAWAS